MEFRTKVLGWRSRGVRGTTESRFVSTSGAGMSELCVTYMSVCVRACCLAVVCVYLVSVQMVAAWLRFQRLNASADTQVTYSTSADI